MVVKKMVLAGVVAGLMGCVDQSPTALPLGTEAGLAKGGPGGGGGGGGTTLYKARFVVLSESEGEITSDWFPSQGGISISASNPWKGIALSGVTIDLNNFTHGDETQGTCGTFSSGITSHPADWDIDGNPAKSYAGTWKGSVTIKNGYLAFDGDRVVNEVVTPGAGGIHNMVTQQNVTVLTTIPDGFRQEVRNAAIKFSGVSTPDGEPTPEFELACVNYTIELLKTTAP